MPEQWGLSRVCALCCPFAPALVQPCPSKPVRIIAPFHAAGAVDATTRILGERPWARWGQPVIVDSRPGAASNIGAAAAYRAEPDGTTTGLAAQMLAAMAGLELVHIP